MGIVILWLSILLVMKKKEKEKAINRYLAKQFRFTLLNF